MCGLIGFVNTKFSNGFNSNESKAFTELLYMDALRGEDATGIAAQLKDSSYEVLKDNIPAYQFINTQEWNFFPKGQCNTLLGHNRKQTQGSNTSENAHPFVINERYIFFHNGTLNQWKNLKPELKADVDSIVLGHILTECEGDIEKLGEALKDIHGAYATMWIDMEKNILYILRNMERPLLYGTTSFGYAFASEGAMLVASLFRNLNQITDIKAFNPHTLYSLSLTEKDAKFKEEIITIKKPFPPVKQEESGQKHITTDFNYSKNAYKGIRKKWLGKKIEFWIDDYNELYPSVKNDDWFIFGNSEEIPFSKHMIKAIIKNVKEDTILLTWDGALMSGIVNDVEMDTKSNLLIFWVTQVNKVPSSITYC